MERRDKIDIALRVLTIIGIIFSFFYGIYRYEEVNADESAKAFWAQQFPVYKELCISASTIATSTDSIDVIKSTNDFWRMYYGEARMVVDWQVHEKMSAFASVLKDVERGFKEKDELTYVSYELATQCRKSISDSWNIPLNQLE